MMLRVLLVASLSGLPAVASAQPAANGQAAADELAQVSARAKAAFESAQYAEAVALYQQAYRLEPVATLLYNIAFIYETHLGDRALARDFYRRYVNAPDAEPGARLKAFERIAVFDAEDARRAQLAAVAPAPAAPPTPRAQPASVAQPVPVAQPASVQPAVVSAAQPVEARVQPATGDNTLSVVFLGVGGAALLVSGVSTVLVAGTHDDYLAARTPAGRADLAEEGERQSLIADLGLAVGVSAVAVGLWLLLSDDDAATSWVPAPVNGEPGLVFGHAF